MKTYFDLILELGVHTCAYRESHVGYRMMQSPKELAMLCDFIQANDIHSYMEVGLADGGTWTFLTDAFGFAPSCGITLDLPEGFRQPESGVYFHGDSLSEEARVWAENHGPFDLVFLDGGKGTAEDHRRDFDLYSPLARFVAHHDVLGLHGCGMVKEYWDEVTKTYPATTVLVDQEHPIGIGIIKMPR
jgi:hypothetical protein